MTLIDPKQFKIPSSTALSGLDGIVKVRGLNIRTYSGGKHL
jgi:hypothetical protein